MTAHPLLTAMLVVDTVAVLLVLYAAFGAIGILLHWAPESATTRQLRLERVNERITMAARASFLFSLIAAAGFVAAIAAVLPPLIPGAMCGTGVLQNMGELGPRAILSRGALVTLFAIWHLLGRMDAAAPIPKLITTTARLLLVTAPIAVLALVHLVQAVRAVDVMSPVDCCATVYTAAASGIPPLEPTAALPLIAVTGVCALLLIGCAIVIIRTQTRYTLLIKLVAPLSVFSALWSGHTLVRVFAPYHFGVLAHHCAWCLFLPEHHLAGVPLYLALITVMAEGPAVFLADSIGRRHPELTPMARLRARRGALRLLFAVILFVALTFVPALVWRLRYGVWITG